MDQFATVDPTSSVPIPPPLQALFADHTGVRVQKLPSLLPGLDSKVVYFDAGARTVPHRHAQGQHLVVTDGVGVIGDEAGVHVVRTGDVISNPPGGWHWHGGTPTTAMAHLTVEDPGLDLDVEQRDWSEVYTPDLGA